MKLNNLERNGHLYYANSTCDISKLEESITHGISKNQLNGLWFCKKGIPLLCDLDLAVRISFMEREHKGDSYGFVIAINTEDMSKRAKASLQDYLPIGKKARLCSSSINKSAISCVYLFDFVGDKRELGLQSKYLEEKHHIQSGAYRVYTRRQGNLTSLLTQELKS